MSNFLEIDSKILEKNLLLQENAEAENLENLFRSPDSFLKETANWKLVTPTAGFCVKTTDSRNKKVFINICKLDDIPEPRDITETELLELWQSDDVPDFRIPLSIQEPHDEFDKSGNPTVAYDVAVNTRFFQKIQTNMVFRSFVMQVVLEGIENKFDVELKKEGYVVLQNRKSLGELKPHRIRTSKTHGGGNKPLIQELSSTNAPSGSGDHKINPQHRLYEDTNKCLVGEFHLPAVATSRDLNLEVNEDRIVLESGRGGYLSDFFIPVRINEAETTASFNITDKILTVRMPISSSAT